MVCSATSAAERRLAARGPVALMLPGGQRSATLRFVEHSPATLAREAYGHLTTLLWHGLHEIEMWDRDSEPVDDQRTAAALGAFRALNHDIAEALLHESAGSPGRFLVHDYQLALVPALLRSHRPDALVLFFHHVAWPSVKGLRLLPRDLTTRLLQGMLGADQVVFFAERWRRNFLRCVDAFVAGAEVDQAAGVVSWGGRRVESAVEPLSCSLDAVAECPPEWPTHLASWAADRPLFVHSGRTDPIKNAGRLVRAFRSLLEGMAPDEATAPRLLLRMNAHRLDLAANRRYLEETRWQIGRLCEDFGGEPARLSMGNDRAVTFGALARADAVVVNSLVDGQNLTVFEAALLRQEGSIILSKNCGAAESLGAVVTLVDPYDEGELVSALGEALQRQGTRTRAAEVASRLHLGNWTDRQVARLQGT